MKSILKLMVAAITLTTVLSAAGGASVRTTGPFVTDAAAVIKIGTKCYGPRGGLVRCPGQ